MISFVIIPLVVLLYVIVAPVVGRRLKKQSNETTWAVYKNESLNQKAS